MDLVSLDSPGETEFVASFLNQGLRFRDLGLVIFKAVSFLSFQNLLCYCIKTHYV